MAAYDYKCAAAGCGHVAEGRFPMGQAPAALTCPLCGGAAKKQFVVLHARRPSKSLDSTDSITRFQFRELG
jgi:putative FmdB family regulatory protein